MPNVLRIPAVFCCLLAFAGCAGMGSNRTTAAAGADARSSGPVSFMEADRDGDARITRPEFNFWLQGNSGEHDTFEAADANRDGVLTLDEWPAMVRRPGAAAGASAPRSRP
jgi:hypothetical protein